MENKIYSVEEMIEKYATNENSIYLGGGIKQKFDVSKGLTPELKLLLKSLINGNLIEGDFDSVRLMFDDRREKHMLLCECGKMTLINNRNMECECGNENSIEIYLEESEKQLMGRSVYKLEENENKLSFIVFNYFCEYGYGNFEVEVLTPMYIEVNDKELIVYQDYRDRDDYWGRLEVMKKYLDDCYVHECDATYLHSYENTSLASGSNIIIDEVFNKLNISAKLEIDTFGDALSLIAKSLKHKNCFFDNPNNDDNIKSLNSTIVKDIERYYNSLKWNYNERDYEYTVFEKALYIESIKKSLGENGISDILRDMKIFTGDDCLSMRDLDLRYIVNISRFKNLAEEFEVKSYILEYMYQYNKNLSFSDIANILSIYDRAIRDKKDIHFADYIKYMFRYVVAEDISISSALKHIDSSYKYINKFKGAFSTSFYNNAMLKDKIGVEKFSFLEELSKCKSFDAIYKKLVC